MKRQSQHNSSRLIPPLHTDYNTVIKWHSHTTPLHSCTLILIRSLSRQGFAVVRHSCALNHSVPNPNLNRLHVPLPSGFFFFFFCIIQRIADKEMTRWYHGLCVLGWDLGLLFSTCPGNWPFSSPQMLSCLLYGHPAGTGNTDRSRSDSQNQSLPPPHSLPVRWALVLTVAKVAWNKRFSKRFPSAKVSSKAVITQRNKSTSFKNLKLTRFSLF